MLNQRLQTQPLDPTILQKLGIDPPTGSQAAPKAAATQPLQSLELERDNWRSEPLARQDTLPAQSHSISQALTTQLNPQEAELLLNVSANLASLRQQQPQQFQTVLSGLQNLQPGQQGSVDFSALSSEQSQALNGLGLTPQNTYTIFQQLNQMILPDQGNNSQAFQKIQASVTRFISNLDLRQQTVSHLHQQASDLTAVQGVVSSLSAGSIGALLKDQTAGVYDLGISTITSENFQLQSGMDYTLARFMVESQHAPQTLQQLEGLIGKVKQDQPLQAQERQLLNQFGLNLNAHNKLESLIDGHSLDFSAVKQLEDVIYSMKDPSPAYQQVLQASANVIQKSGKIQELEARVALQSETVLSSASTVQEQTRHVQQLRTDTNFLESRVKFSQHKVDNLAATMATATGLFRSGPVNHELLAAFNIRVDESNHQRQFFINNRAVSGLEALKHLGDLVREHEAEIQTMFQELAAKKVETIKASADLGQAKENLVVQTQVLEDLGNEISLAKDELEDANQHFNATVIAVAPELKPEEKDLVATQITPIVAEVYEQGMASAERAQTQITETVVIAQEAIVAAETEIIAVEADLARWELTLNSVKASLDNLGTQLTQLNNLIQQVAKPTADHKFAVAPQSDETESVGRPATLPRAEPPDLLADLNDPETLALNRHSKNQVQAQIESDFHHHQTQEKRQNEAREQAQRMADFYREARENLQAQQERLRTRQ